LRFYGRHLLAMRTRRGSYLHGQPMPYAHRPPAIAGS
jgi:hypothetical protein